MTPTEIIAAFGGRNAVAEITGAKPNAITQWRRVRVPPAYWHVLVAAAKDRRISGIDFDVLEQARPKRNARAPASGQCHAA